MRVFFGTKNTRIVVVSSHKFARTDANPHTSQDHLTRYIMNGV